MPARRTEHAYTLRWVATLFVGLVFAAAGAAKVLGGPVFTAWFLDWGIPLELMRALGFVEIACVLALAIPRSAPYAALALCTIAFGAMLVQVIHGNVIPAVLPMLLGAGSAIIVWGTPRHRVAPREPGLLPEAEDELGLGWVGSERPATQE
jgi:uncharacterized membrane protein YphA (DoxX/SURF4 family)